MLGIIGGIVGGIGSMISAGKKRKALKEQEKNLASQRTSAIAEQQRIQQQYQQGISGVRDQLRGLPVLTEGSLAQLDLRQARGLYGNLTAEARRQQSGLLSAARGFQGDIMGSAQGYRGDITSAAQGFQEQMLGAAQGFQGQLVGAAGDISEREMGAAQTRVALAADSRVAGEELARDAARQASAEAIAQQRRVGGTGSSLLSAIAQTAGQEMSAQRQLSQQFGSIREQRALDAQRGLMAAEQAAGARELGALQAGGQAVLQATTMGGQSVLDATQAGGQALLQAGQMGGQAVLQAGQMGGQQLMSALGSQAGAIAQLSQAEVDARREAQMAAYQSQRERGLRLADLGLTEAGQMAQFQLGQQQLGLDFSSQQNQASIARGSTSILGAGLGAIGGGLLGLAQSRNQLLASQNQQYGS